MTTTNYDVILSPVITEKATKLTEANQVVFRVTLDATKPAIAKAVADLFKVKVKAVNTVRIKGKRKAFRGKPYTAKRLQESDRDARRGPPDRHHDGIYKMALKQYKPTTPGQRQLVLIDRSGLHKGGPVKALTEGQHRKGGRNNTGRVTVRWQGGGHKQRYRIDRFQAHANSTCPQRSSAWNTIPTAPSFIALIKYKDGELAYILAPQRLAVGDTVVSGDKVDVKPGNAMPLGAMPVGTIVHNIEMKPGKGGQIARSAGTYAQYLGRDAGYALLRLNSTEVRKRAAHLHGHGWRGVESRSYERSHRQGRPQCVEGQAPLCARHGDEPDRPSPWRRRRPHQGRPSSGHAVGQADQGRQDPQEQAHDEIHRAYAQRQEHKGN